MPSQPSPSRPARLIAASERPPMMMGTGSGRRGGDDCFVKVEEPAVEGDRLAGQQLAHDGQAFIHPQAPGRRVHPADRDFVAILAAYPDAEDEPSGGEPGDVGQLAGHQDGMAQRQQVHAAVDGQRGVKHRQRRGLHEPVEPQAGETDVVAAADVVDAFLLGLRQECAGSLRALLEQPGRREHADPGGYSRAAPCLRWPRRRGDYCPAVHVACFLSFSSLRCDPGE